MSRRFGTRGTRAKNRSGFLAWRHRLKASLEPQFRGHLSPGAAASHCRVQKKPGRKAAEKVRVDREVKKVED